MQTKMKPTIVIPTEARTDMKNKNDLKTQCVHARTRSNYAYVIKKHGILLLKIFYDIKIR
jgi:hypothetical protein